MGASVPVRLGDERGMEGAVLERLAQRLLGRAHVDADTPGVAVCLTPPSSPASTAYVTSLSTGTVPGSVGTGPTRAA
jgi:hypothetical protein